MFLKQLIFEIILSKNHIMQQLYQLDNISWGVVVLSAFSDQ